LSLHANNDYANAPERKVLFIPFFFSLCICLFKNGEKTDVRTICYSKFSSSATKQSEPTAAFPRQKLKIFILLKSISTPITIKMGTYCCLYMPTMIKRTRQNVRFGLYFFDYVFVYVKMGEKHTCGQFVILNFHFV